MSLLSHLVHPYFTKESYLAIFLEDIQKWLLNIIYWQLPLNQSNSFLKDKLFNFTLQCQSVTNNKNLRAKEAG